jgi:hypothetical protein
MTLAKAKSGADKTFIVQASLTIVTYNHQNIFIVQATEVVSRVIHLVCSFLLQLTKLFFPFDLRVNFRQKKIVQSSLQTFLVPCLSVSSILPSAITSTHDFVKTIFNF